MCLIKLISMMFHSKISNSVTIIFDIIISSIVYQSAIRVIFKGASWNLLLQLDMHA